MPHSNSTVHFNDPALAGRSVRNDALRDAVQKHETGGCFHVAICLHRENSESGQILLQVLFCRQRLDERLHGGGDAADSLRRSLRVLVFLAEHDPGANLEMPIEVVDKLAQKIPWHRRSSNVAVGRHDALHIVKEVLIENLQVARDCIHSHQGVAFVSAVLVAQDDNCVQLLLQLRREAEVAGVMSMMREVGY